MDRRALPRSRAFAEGERGFSVIELLIALAIMALLGSSLIALMGAGGDAFRRVLSDRDAQAEARIAVSYVTVKIRQNDARGRVSIEASDSEAYPGNVLKIKDDALADGGGVNNDERAGGGGGDGGVDGIGGDFLFIYYYEEGGIDGSGGGSPYSVDSGGLSETREYTAEPGLLVEKRSTSPGVGDPRGEYIIATVSGFDVSYVDEAHSQIKVTAYYLHGDSLRSLESLVTLRAP